MDYITTYLQGMNYEVKYLHDGDFIPCELCKRQMNDVHHIDRRGMGGTTKEYFVEQLMALCRDQHFYYGDKKKYRSYLYWAHFICMKERDINIDYSKLPQDLFFEQYSEAEKLSSIYYSIIINKAYSEEITYETINEEEIMTITIRDIKKRLVLSLSGTNKLDLITKIIPVL